jgi:hypothetical protein
MTDGDLYIRQQLEHGKGWIFTGGFGLGYIRGLKESHRILKSTNSDQLKAQLIQKVKDAGSFEVKMGSDKLGEVTAVLNVLALIDGEPLFEVATELSEITEYTLKHLTYTVREPIRGESV